MDDPFAPLGGGDPSGRRARPKFSPIAPIPDHAPTPPAAHPKLGKPSARWTYRDADGGVIGFVLRFDRGAGEKEFRPLVLYREDGRDDLVWRWESWPAPRPLYRLDDLASRPSAPVVVCEGEKSADAADKLLPGHVAVTSPNGSKSAGKADWTPLRGRAVTIWPDADAAGLDYAEMVGRILREVGAESVAVVVPPEGAKVGWDAADALHEDGWTKNRTLELLAAARAAAAPQEPKAQARKAGDGGRKRRPQRDDLMGLTEFVDLWHGEDGKAFATFPVMGHRETWPVRSEVFKRWLAAQAYERLDLVPGAQAVEDTLRVLEARAGNEGRRQSPWLRVGARDGKLYLDLCDAAWRAVEIGPHGWQVLDKHDLPFIRSKAMHPLPEPEAGWSINELRRFANVATDEDFALVVAWMVAALRQKGPYPILVVNGEQGSGKSTFSRLIRSVVDPNAAPIRAAPREERDLITWAANGHAIVMDNLSKISPELADGLCRLATGGGFSARQLHTDLEESVFMGVRPIILNGIPLLTDRPDLADRAVTIRLSSIPEDERRPEDEFWEDWAEVAPRVLGALCDGLCAAVRRVRTVKLERSPRLADFAKWVTAAEPGLGWAPGTFMRVYGDNRRDVTDATFEADLVAVAIRDLMHSEECRDWGWRGTPTELLEVLCQRADERAIRTRSWPQTAQALGNRLDRITPLLRAKGIAVERRHSGVRQVTLAWLDR